MSSDVKRPAPSSALAASRGGAPRLTRLAVPSYDDEAASPRSPAAVLSGQYPLNSSVRMLSGSAPTSSRADRMALTKAGGPAR